MAELVYVMALTADMDAAGVDTAGIRVTGDYGIKHINLLPADIWNSIRFDVRFLALSQADTDDGLKEETLADWFAAKQAILQSEQDALENLLLGEMGV